MLNCGRLVLVAEIGPLLIDLRGNVKLNISRWDPRGVQEGITNGETAFGPAL